MAKRRTDRGSNSDGDSPVDGRLLILAEALKKARKANGLTQCELAGLMNTSQTEIHRMESGEINFGVSKLFDFAKALDGATIEIRIGLDYQSKNGFRTETHFVVLNNKDGEQKRSSIHAYVPEMSTQASVEESIVWLADEDDGDDQPASR